MGISASSLLDETQSDYIKGRAEAELKEFTPYYRKQFSVARFSQVEDDLEPHKEKMTQLLRQRGAPKEGAVLYEEGAFYFDDTRKWKERYMVVRANYCLECHDSLESFVKGVPPRQKLLPTGGAVLTTEEQYMEMVDQCFPDDTNVKEDFAPPLSGMPGQFPVYLRLPYRSDSYFCFRQQAKQADFLSILSDCIRHQNQDFLKKTTCEVQAFLKAIQLYRQDKGSYEVWDMLIGSDVRVMANLVMEQLLPTLQKDLLPRLKAKKTEKKRVWFATVEAAYILVQEHLLEGLAALKEECRTSVRQQEVLIHSDMDQILNSRRQLEEKVRAKVSQPAEKLCSECVQPHLGSVLEEVMQPISSGFQEGRQLSENTMDQVCQDVLLVEDCEQLKKALANTSRPNLLSCYQKIGSLQEKLQHLQERFGFSNITQVIHSAQIDLQQLMENAAYTFELLLHKAVQDNPGSAGSAVEKVKHRVLKQYDYDSSTVRKRISREALVSITLPFIKKNLAPTCKTELQGLEQFIYADHANFIHIENVYEGILLQTLDKEVTKVVKEAASLKKYNLFTDRRDLLSQYSHYSFSTPSSPATAPASLTNAFLKSQPPSPLVVNGPQKEEQQEKENGVLRGKASAGVTETRLVLTEVLQSVAVSQEAAPPEAEHLVHTVQKAEAPASAETTNQTETQEVNAGAVLRSLPVIREEVISVKTEKVETSAEIQTLSPHTPKEAQIPTKTDVEAAAAQVGAPEGAAPTQVGAPEGAAATQVGAPEGAAATQVGAPEGAAPTQVGAPEGAAPTQVGAPEGAAPTQVGAPEGAAPTPPQIETPEGAAAAAHVEAPEGAAASADVEAPEGAAASADVEAPEEAAAASHVEAPEGAAASADVEAPEEAAAAAHVEAPEGAAASAHVEAPEGAAASADVEAPEGAAAAAHAGAPEGAAASADVEAAADVEAPEGAPAAQEEDLEGAAAHVEDLEGAAASADVGTPERAAAAHVEAPEGAADVEAPDPTKEPVNSSTEGSGSQTVASSEEETHCGSSAIKLEAPSSGQTPALTPADVSLDLQRQEAELLSTSDPDSLDVSVGSESAPSDVESTDEVSATSDILEHEVNLSRSPATSDILEHEVNLSKSPATSDFLEHEVNLSKSPATSDFLEHEVNLSKSPATSDILEHEVNLSRSPATSDILEHEVNLSKSPATSDILEHEVNLSKSPATSDILEHEVNLSRSPATSDILEHEVNLSRSPATSDILEHEVNLSRSPASSDDTTSDQPPVMSQDVGVREATSATTPSSPEAQPLDSIKEIRDLVVEVIEVEEMVQRYPSGIPKEE